MAPVIRERYVQAHVREDLEDCMVFVGGARQVGKTIFALGFLDEPSARHLGYMTWDDTRTRQRLLAGELPPGQPVVILDEIHKHARWRNLVKGFWDTSGGERKIIVTGSARLDLYSRGGDSLQGRYHYYRLHPFTIPEAGGEVDTLMAVGGFPEPFLRGEERFSRRWRRERRQRVLYDDVRDLEDVKEISLLELLLSELPSRVGSPLSIASIRDALEVSHRSVERWIGIFERLYHCFRVPPFGARAIRAVKKAQKLYLWDWAGVADRGARFENMVACHLLKYCHFVEDTEGHDMDLRYIRDTDGREVDFVVLRDGEPLFALECKSGQSGVSPHIHYFRERTGIPRFYQVHLGRRDYEKQGVRVLPFATFCDVAGLV